MIEQQLQHILQTRSLHVLLMVTSRALSRSGFDDIEILDRRHSRQRSRYGGHELLCHTTLGGLPARVIVKVINDGIRVRMLDELAGATLRTGATAGLIVCTKAMARSALRARTKYSGVRVDVIDGPTLARMLIREQIGLTESGGVDVEFYDQLERFSLEVNRFVADHR